MTFDLAVMRSELRGHCGYEDETDLPDVDCDLFLNRSLWEVVFDLPLREKEKTQTFQTVVGEPNYEVPIDFESLRVISVLEPTSGKHNKLERDSAASYERNYSENQNDQAIPEFYLREHDCIKLRPVPDDVYTITLKSLINIEDLVHDNDVPNTHRVVYEVILYGAVYRVFLKNNDFISSSHFKAYQTDQIAKLTRRNVESKEETDTSLAGVEAVIPNYP